MCIGLARRQPVRLDSDADADEHLEPAAVRRPPPGDRVGQTDPGGPFRGEGRPTGPTACAAGAAKIGYGNSWVVLAIVVTVPFAPIALPILFALCVKGGRMPDPDVSHPNVEQRATHPGLSGGQASRPA